MGCARSVVEARPEDLVDVLARSAADAVPAVPAERDALLRELLSGPVKEVLGPSVAREIGEAEAGRLLAR